VREATKAAMRDLQTMEQDASFKAQKVQFLLDSTLGRINLVQNDIIKLFSVIAVIFMPPTVIASIYGMNFKEMPGDHHVSEILIWLMQRSIIRS
jgi:magnesium transporter